MMQFDIRPFHLTDLTALYRICLLTGANGEDATPIFSDYDLLGHYFAAPYALLQPELCFVLTCDATPVGYILGCADSAEFYQMCEQQWFPPLRQRYPKAVAATAANEAHFGANADRWTKADKSIINLIDGGIPPEAGLEAYPAHLHIDLLPIGQKRGFGRQLMTVFWDKLRALGVPAVHLGVSRANTNAVSFYQHIGYHIIDQSEYGLALGKHL